MTGLKQEGNEVTITLFFTKKPQFSFKQLVNPEIKAENGHYFESS